MLSSLSEAMLCAKRRRVVVCRPFARSPIPKLVGSFFSRPPPLPRVWHGVPQPGWCLKNYALCTSQATHQVHLNLAPRHTWFARGSIFSFLIGTSPSSTNQLTLSAAVMVPPSIHHALTERCSLSPAPPKSNHCPTGRPRRRCCLSLPRSSSSLSVRAETDARTNGGGGESH